MRLQTVATGSTMNVFAYGSLMFAPVWRKIVGRSCPGVRARLGGYSRRIIRGEVYPCAIASQLSDCIDGVLYINIDMSDIERLDAFEGPRYTRMFETCLRVHGGCTHAYVYVLRDAWSHLVDTRPWNPRQFARSGIKRFLSTYQGFARLR